MNTVESSSSPEPSAAAALRPRLGFLGLGWIGTHRLAAIGRAGVAEIIAIADPLDEMLAAAAQHAPKAVRFKNPAAPSNLGQDGIIIATPSAQHAQQCTAPLRREPAASCQKP